MATFTGMKASEVLIGRGRLAAERRAPFIEALRTAEAGRIELTKDDRPNVVKRVLAEAAQEVGVKVRSSWENSDQKTLFWRRTSNSSAPAANSAGKSKKR